jgi:uncharacterized protein YigA (DUF484 family)
VGNPEPSLSAEQVSAYLKQHRDFLISQPDVLQELTLGDSPDGTVSLVHFQRKQLERKTHQLQEQLNALLENAESNNQLQQRVNALILALMDCQDGEALLTTLVTKLHEEFQADAVSLQIFSQETMLTLPDLNANVAVIHPDDPQLKAFDHVLANQVPVCGRLTKKQKQTLFGEQAESANSIACLPLGQKPCAGLLAIASQDANRFHADMGTEYLQFLGDVFMRLMRRFYCGQTA